MSKAHLVEEAGSVACLCIRVRLMMCSFMDIWTSAGISGEVWLILTAASKKPKLLASFSLSAMASLSLAYPVKVDTFCGAAAELDDTALFLQGTHHSFQKRKRKTATRARPHTITITARRLTDRSTGAKKAGSDIDREEGRRT